MDKEPLIHTDEESRTITFMGEINETSISKLIWAFRTLINKDDAEDKSKKNYNRKPIHFHIDSRGGYVYEGNALLSLMVESKTPIYTYCDGFCMSMGFMLYLAGSKRYAGCFARFMYHQISTGVKGTLTSIKEDIEQTEILNNALMAFVHERTNIPIEELEFVCTSKKDWYFSRGSAIDCGIVTEE